MCTLRAIWLNVGVALCNHESFPSRKNELNLSCHGWSSIFTDAGIVKRGLCSFPANALTRRLAQPNKGTFATDHPREDAPKYRQAARQSMNIANTGWLVCTIRVWRRWCDVVRDGIYTLFMLRRECHNHQTLLPSHTDFGLPQVMIDR